MGEGGRRQSIPKLWLVECGPDALAWIPLVVALTFRYCRPPVLAQRRPQAELPEWPFWCLLCLPLLLALCMARLSVSDPGPGSLM